MFKRLIFIILVFSGPFAEAQSQIKFNPYFGKIAKHKAGLYYDTPPYSLGFEFTYSSRTSGAIAWHNRWKRPTTEITFLHYYLGDNEVLGSLTAIIPHLGFYLIEKEKTSFMFHLGLGTAYVTKKFDEINNPLNNAIGSNFNCLINVKFTYEWTLTERLNLYSGLSFTHFSNGRTSSPNSGINIPGIFTGFALNLNKRNFEEKAVSESSLNKKWGFNIHYGYGINESNVPGGPKYSINILSVSGLYSTDPFNKILFGWEYEYHNKEYALAIAGHKEEEEAKKQAKKQMLFLADELLFGNISVRFQIGYYLLNQQKQNINTKLFVNYRIPIEQISSSLYIGIMMKTHFARATYLSLVAGYEF